MQHIIKNPQITIRGSQMLKRDQGGKECFRISVLCGNVDNPAISSDLKIIDLSIEEISFLMRLKSQFPRSSLRLKCFSCPQCLSFLGTIRLLGQSTLHTWC